jgi:hypothetical protein
MTCEACGQEITDFYVRFKKFGSDDYMNFHVANGTDRAESCWGIWTKRNLDATRQSFTDIR